MDKIWYRIPLKIIISKQTMHFCTILKLKVGIITRKWIAFVSWQGGAHK